MLTFGERIGALRRRQGMTQRELGVESEVHPNTIARLERGNLTDMPGKAVARIAKALGTTADYLLGLTEREEPYEERDSEEHPTTPALVGAAAQ